MENKIFNLPSDAAKYNIRSTGEEVEIIAFHQEIDGDKSEADWVTYIDSKGKEHIKEHLNIQLDFKAKMNDMWSKMLDISKSNKYPTERNRRIFEVAKVYIEKGYKPDVSVENAIELVDKIGIEYNE